MKTDAEKVIKFTLLYNKYKKKLYNFVLRLSGDEMIAEDVIHNIFMRFYDSYSEIRDINSINFWLFKSARNEYYNYYRKNRRLTEYSEEILNDIDSDSDLESQTELKDYKRLIFAELEKVPEDQKEVYLLKEYGGLSYNEIAETLQIDVNLVKSRLYKVRQKLIDKISKLI